MALQDKISQFSADADIVSKIANGDATTVVQTKGGAVRSLAKLIADGQAAINAAIAAAFPGGGGGGGGGGGSVSWGAIVGALANQTDLVAALGTKQNTLPAGNLTQYLRGDKVMATLDKTAVGLPNVDNTSDASKPVSTAQATALALKAPVNSPALTGTPTAPTAAVGTDSDQIATMKAIKNAVAGLGGGGAPAAWGAIGGTLDDQADLKAALAGKQAKLPAGSSTQYLRGDGTVANLDKSAAGLPNVDNTSDASKPVSTAQANALALKAPLASPALTGTPTAPTAALGTDTDQIATMKAVKAAVGAGVGGGMANPMTTAGDIIVGGANGVPQRVPKGAPGQFYGPDGWATPSSSAASNARNVTYNPVGGLEVKLDKWLEVKRTIFSFGAVGTDKDLSTTLRSRYGNLAAAKADYPFLQTDADLDSQIDWAALQAACIWMDANRKPIDLAGAKLNINRWVTMGAIYCLIYGNNAEIGGRLQAKGKIDNSTPATDLSYPTDTDPGPMQGCCFYFPHTIYYPRIERVRFIDYRFCVAFNKDPNSATLDKCYFGYTNCGVITYQGSQTLAMVNCGGDRLGVAYIGSATCFPGGSPYANLDNTYTDGFKLLNAVAGEFESFGIDEQPNFDAWFIQSFIRPNVDSVTIPGTAKYTDRWGQIYTDNYTDGNGKTWPQGYFLNPTGRVFFLPFRTRRMCYTLTLIGADTRGKVKYGYGICNTEINALKVEDINYEGMYNYAPAITDDRPVVLTMGSLVTGTTTRQSQISYIEENHGLYAYTARGDAGASDGSTMVFLGANPIIKKYEKLIGFTTGWFRHLSVNIPIRENVGGRGQGYTGAGFPKDYRQELFNERKVFSNQETEWVVSTMPHFLQLPSLDTNGVLRSDAIISYIEGFCGYLHVQTWNHSTGATDYGVFEIDTYEPETLTLASAVANGATQVTFTSAPRVVNGNMTRLCTYRPNNTGKGFACDKYLGGTTMRVMGQVAGLPATLAAGSTVSRAPFVRPVRAFQNTFLEVRHQSLNNTLPGQEAGQLGFKNANGDSIHIAYWYSHFATGGY